MQPSELLPPGARAERMAIGDHLNGQVRAMREQAARLEDGMSWADARGAITEAQSTFSKAASVFVSHLKVEHEIDKLAVVPGMTAHDAAVTAADTNISRASGLLGGLGSRTALDGSKVLDLPVATRSSLLDSLDGAAGAFARLAKAM